MRVRWKIACRQRVRFISTDLAQEIRTEAGAIAGVDGDATLKIWKAKGRGPVAAVGRPQEGKERGILRNRKQLPVAQGKASRGKIAAEENNHAKKWIHRASLKNVGGSCLRRLLRPLLFPPKGISLAR